ncbi:hypothetical protein D4Q76_01095 [archaeon]|nr:MAG: hypothetical protein D4Q76_01095 [archaeon]
MKNASGEPEIKSDDNFSLLFLKSHEGVNTPFAGIFSYKGKAYTIRKVNKKITESHGFSIFKWDVSKDAVIEEPEYLKMSDIVDKSSNPEEPAYLTTVAFEHPSIETIDNTNEENIKFKRSADAFLQFISGKEMRDRILSVTPEMLLEKAGTEILGKYYTLAPQIQKKYIESVAFK